MKRLLLGLLLASPVLVFAQGSVVNTQNQKIVGMAGAGSALFIDEASMVYSPGALAKMGHNAVQVGGNAIMFRSAFQEVGSMDSYRTRSQVSTPFAAYATYAPDGAFWRAGLAVYTPFGGGVDWGNNWPGRYELNELSLRAIFIQPTVSFKITDQFSVGGGFIYNVGTVELGRVLPAFNADGSPSTARLTGTGTGTGYTLGAHYHLENEFAFSVTYRSKVVTSLNDGDAEFRVPQSIAGNFPNTNFSSELPLPSSLSVGIAFPVAEKIKMAVDGSIINYNIYEQLAFEYESDRIPNTVSEKNYQKSYTARVGVNYQAKEKLALRAGVGYIRTPVRENFVSPETPDNNRYVLSAGVTYDITPKWELNAAYAFQHILPRTTTNTAINLQGRYETYIHAPGVSVSYKW